MLETDFIKEALEVIGNSKYRGIESSELLEALLGSDFDDDDFLKAKYHLDEMWDAGLFKGRDGPGKNGWGYQGEVPRVLLLPIPLVLTPIGAELLEELNKPKGLERFKNAIRSAGSVAGSEAVRFAVGELFKL